MGLFHDWWIGNGLALDCRIGESLADCLRIGGLEMDWQTGMGLADWHGLGNELADYQQVVRLVLDRYWIGRLE